MLSPERLEELKARAKAATPGPWEVHGANVHTVAATEPTYITEVSLASLSSPRGGNQRDKDAAHIAACDPQTILELIAMVPVWRPMNEFVGNSAIIFDAKWGVVEGHRYDNGKWHIGAFNGQMIEAHPLSWQSHPIPPALSTNQPIGAE